MLIDDDKESAGGKAVYRGSVVDPTTAFDQVDTESKATSASTIIMLNALFSPTIYPHFVSSGDSLTRAELDLKKTKENHPVWPMMHAFIMEPNNNVVIHSTQQNGK